MNVCRSCQRFTIWPRQGLCLYCYPLFGQPSRTRRKVRPAGTDKKTKWSRRKRGPAGAAHAEEGT